MTSSKYSRPYQDSLYSTLQNSPNSHIILFILTLPLINSLSKKRTQLTTMQTCMEYSTAEDDSDVLSHASSTKTVVDDDDTKLSPSLGSEAAMWPSSRFSLTTKPHAAAKDLGWAAIRRVEAEPDGLGIEDLEFIQRVGSGDIGSVYLVELKGARGCKFAAKVMDKEELACRSKESRARIEREILEMLDHPFLPTLYANLDTDNRWSCLLTEFCPGGDLHVLRQKQPDRRFNEAAVTNISYSSHVRLVKHIPTLARASCILPNCIVPTISCFRPRLHGQRRRRPGHCHRSIDVVAEPIDARSMSFVGTHEYLSPEIVSGEGHGNAVDWWTLGIFIFEMFYGVTPFKGSDNEYTLANIVARGVEFPKDPTIPGPMKDLITQLLIKDPTKRMGSTMGATAIKHHPFFHGVNWALLRCTKPPSIPQLVKHLYIFTEPATCSTSPWFCP